MRAVRPVDVAALNFREPFVGHLPGYLAASELTAPGEPSQDVYNDLLMRQWRALIDSPESKDESLIHEFLERYPSLLPGSNTVDGDSGHSAFPAAVISKPKLAGLSDRQPDFMWLATNSEALFPILIEIETPHKQWFLWQTGRDTPGLYARARTACRVASVVQQRSQPHGVS